TDNPIFLRGMGFVAGAGSGLASDGYDFTTFPEVVMAAQQAYDQAGITDPASEVSLAEVHDCFTPTELVLMEDLGFSERGKAWRDILDGRYDLDGALPVNTDGGLKSFGHPIGATGLRMMFECFTQLRGEAGERQVEGARLAVAQNLGGQPGSCVAFVAVLGNERGAGQWTSTDRSSSSPGPATASAARTRSCWPSTAPAWSSTTSAGPWTGRAPRPSPRRSPGRSATGAASPSHPPTRWPRSR